MKVLLATDCSQQAAAAAGYLQSLKFTAPISLTIITALGDPYGSSPESTQHWFPELLRQERARAETHQAELATQLRDRCTRIDTICRPGHPVKIVLGEAADLDCDLIVIGARGHSFLGRLLIGSVSDSIATHAKCSVLVVRPPKDDEDKRDRDPDRANHILVGYDSSNASREAVEEIASLDWDPETEVELLSVAPIYDYLLGNGLSTAAIANEEEIFKEMKQGGDEMKHRIEAVLPKTQSVIMHDQRVGDAIADLAEKSGSDLVVVGDSGHSLLDDFLLGSTTKYVLRHAPCSVWISRHHRTSSDEGTAETNANDASK
ncbi:Universal stress protein [Stieleria maiorica]|uniref:Universal stress protein n=1 Tax=Stieleria maiorica TaxID=2795974 RepID=A0A5B9MMV5_9BACT|nr:universal stress protein [Stieleria maiorica]QEG01247.1 Universal stress protein [Stieleria maiorica]